MGFETLDFPVFYLNLSLQTVTLITTDVTKILLLGAIGL